ncbi:MAG: hypothetical protein ABIR70_02340 [Bryobacteraceae bacterium]
MRILSGLILLSGLSFAQVITTVAGTATSSFGGDGGPATSAWIQGPQGVAVDAAGNFYFADVRNIRIRKVNTAGIISTFAGDGTIRSVLVNSNLGDGGQATATGLNPSPSLFQGVAVDNAGNVYISDGGNRRVRKVNPQGVISTYAGGGSGGDGGLATNAALTLPSGIAVDNDGNLYIADPPAGKIRKVNTSGIISTVAGTGSLTPSGDGGPATQAGIGNPLTVAVDNQGNIYLTESATFRVRKVSASGIITTIAGNGIGFSGDGGPATQAKFGDLRGLAADTAGNLYISDFANFRIRKLDTAGIVNTIAGIGTAGIFLENGDRGLPSNARLSPSGLALDSAGNLFISDSDASRIRKINFSAIAPGLSMSHWTMSFASTPTNAPASQTMKVSSAGPPLPFRLTTTSDSPSGSWMTPVSTTGTTPQSFGISIRNGLDPGTYQGTITATPTIAGYQPVTATVTLTISQTVPAKPVITSIVSGASFQAGLSPNSIYTIQGTNLASTTDTWDRFIVGGKLPTSLGGVIVTIGNIPAYLTYISPTQINFVAPDIGIIFSSAIVNNNGSSSAIFPIQANQYNPAFFAWPGSQVVATRTDYTFAVRNGTFGAATVAAKPGDVLILWGTGFGPTSPLTLPGSVVPSDQTYSTATPPTVTINNIPAVVYGAALASGYVGLYQVAIQVPTSLGSGDWPIVASIGGAQSPSTLLLSVRP